MCFISDSNKIINIKFCKLAQIRKILIISSRLCLPLTKNLNNTSATQNYLLTLRDNSDDVIDDVNNDLVPRVMHL